MVLLDLTLRPLRPSGWRRFAGVASLASLRWRRQRLLSRSLVSRIALALGSRYCGSMNAKYWIDKLGLQPHPEGGYYKETWRSELILPAEVLPQKAERSAGTSIYFLLETGQESAWHRVASAELWIHQLGDSLELSIDREATKTIRLGPDGEMQAVVSPNEWQSAKLENGEAGYALVCCVVVPGFDFEDFEM